MPANSKHRLRAIAISVATCALVWIAGLFAFAAPPLSAKPQQKAEPPLTLASIDFSPDGTRILCTYFGPDKADRNNFLQLWDTYTGKPVGAPIRHPRNYALYARWNRDGSRVVTFSEEEKTGVAQLWDAKSGAAIGGLMQNAGESGFPLFSDANGFLATMAGGKVSKWDPVTGKRLAQTRDKEHIEKLLTLAYGHRSAANKPVAGLAPVPPITVAPGITRRISKNAAGTLEITDGASGKTVATLGPGIDSYQTFPENKRLLLAVMKWTSREIPAGGYERQRVYQTWDLRTGKALGGTITVKGSDELAITRDGAHYIAWVPDKNCCGMWDAATGRPFATLRADNIRNGPYEISPKGTYIATAAGADLMLWSSATGKKVYAVRPAGM